MRVLRVTCHASRVTSFMNILLTDKCSNSCPYCFAKEKLEADSRLNQMPLENYRKALDFLRKSRNRSVKLLGGEPMLHSDIREIINMTVDDDDFESVVIFSGGIFDKSLVHLLAHEKIHVVLNTNHPSDYKDGKWEIFMKNLDYMISLGVDVTPGYNIYKTDFEYDFILDILDYYKLKNLRWTVAVPMHSYENRHVPFDDYRKMGKRITEFLLTFADMGVESRLDCFLPLCTFNDTDYGKLIKTFPSMAKGGFCRPAIDVGPDLTVWRCFAISSYENVNLENFSNLRELTGFFMSSFDHYKWHIWPEQCEKCKYRLSRICQSSCLAFKVKEIKKFLEEEKSGMAILAEAKELLDKNDMPSASVKYKEAMEKAPKSIKIKADSSFFYIRAGDFVTARTLLDEIEKEYPDYSIIPIYRGIINEEEKDYQGAIRNYRKALRLCPRENDLKDRIKKLRSLQILNMGFI